MLFEIHGGRLATGLEIQYKLVQYKRTQLIQVEIQTEKNLLTRDSRTYKRVFQLMNANQLLRHSSTKHCERTVQ